jgi:hypothetical protein
MFKIKIEKEFNPTSDMIGKWFVKYNAEISKPIFTDEEENAGIFVPDFNSDNALYGNLMALNDRFGIKGTPVPLNVA